MQQVHQDATSPALQPNSRFQVSSVAVSFWFLGLTKNDTPLQDPEPNIWLSLLGTCCNCCSCCNYVPIVWQRHLRGQWNPPSGTQRANHRPTSMPPQLDRWNSTYTKNTSIQFIASLSASHFMLQSDAPLALHCSSLYAAEDSLIRVPSTFQAPK